MTDWYFYYTVFKVLIGIAYSIVISCSFATSYFMLIFCLRWRIRARVTQKSNIRTWSNSRGEGRLFSVNLIDESGEIRATGFTDVVDKYYEMLEVNKVSWYFWINFCSTLISLFT